MRANSGHEIVAPHRQDLDIRRRDQVDAALAGHRPELVINCAAFHNVPMCEERAEEAFRINCVAMRDLATACDAAGVKLVTFSSDYVFGGEKRSPYVEDDLPRPLQIYGITRLAGEHAVLSAAPNRAIIIRTCGLYGTHGASSKGGNFVDGRVADARAGRRIEMSSDQTVAPTSTDDLSRAVMRLIEHPDARPGIYHLVNEGHCTWYELTVAIVEILGLRSEVVPVDRGGRSGAMRRPLYSVLANTKASALGVVLPPWRDALSRYLRRKHGAPAHTERLE